MVNRIGSIVKLLEVPKTNSLANDISMTRVRAQLPQRRGTILIELVFLGKLANDIITYYKPNDYILIEGYLELLVKQKSKRVEITVLKIYTIIKDSKADTKKSFFIG